MEQWQFGELNKRMRALEERMEDLETGREKRDERMNEVLGGIRLLKYLTSSAMFVSVLLWAISHYVH